MLHVLQQLNSRSRKTVSTALISETCLLATVPLDWESLRLVWAFYKEVYLICGNGSYDAASSSSCTSFLRERRTRRVRLCTATPSGSTDPVVNINKLSQNDASGTRHRTVGGKLSGTRRVPFKSRSDSAGPLF